jgi:hypothetical protein
VNAILRLSNELTDFIDSILGGIGSLRCKPWVKTKRDQRKSKGTKKLCICLVKRTIDEDVLGEGDGLTLALVPAVLGRQRFAAERSFSLNGSIPLVDHEFGTLLPADLESPGFGILLRLEVFGRTQGASLLDVPASVWARDNMT